MQIMLVLIEAIIWKKFGNYDIIVYHIFLTIRYNLQCDLHAHIGCSKKNRASLPNVWWVIIKIKFKYKYILFNLWSQKCIVNLSSLESIVDFSNQDVDNFSKITESIGSFFLEYENNWEIFFALNILYFIVRLSSTIRRACNLNLYTYLSRIYIMKQTWFMFV